MRGVLYGRYSSHAQNDASIDQQFRDCREFCEKNNITIVGEYADRAITGRSDKRPEFQRMVKDAAHGRFQLIVTWKVDRFARNREDAAIYKGRLRRYGVRVVYAKETIPDGPEGVLLESMLEGTAEYYSANLAQNVKRGMRDNALECKVNSGRLPLGYKKGPDGKYAIDPIGAEIVREIFELYAAGLTVSEIYASLNARGIKSAQGHKFNKNSFYKLLKNVRYLGLYIYDDICIPGGIPQIISQELFDKVQKQIEKTKKAPASSWSEVDYLLTGKLYCGHCGSNMIGETGTSKSGRKYNYYNCNKMRRDHSCNKTKVAKDYIERQVVQATIENVLIDEVIDNIADAAVALQRRERDNSILDSLKGQLRDTEKKLNNIIAAIESGLFTTTTRDRMLELEKEKTSLQDAIELESIERPLITRDMLIYWMNRFKGGDLDDEKFRLSIIETFITAIYLYDDQLRIVYNFCGEKNNSVTLEFVNSCDSSASSSCSALTGQRPP